MNGSAMAGGVQISGELAGWASRAGFDLTPTDHQGRAIFSSRDGELRYFVEAVNNGWFRITSSHQADSEQLEIAASSLSTIETYFYGFFGSDIRRKHPLPRAMPDENRRSDRFEIRRLPVAGQDYPALREGANRNYLALYEARELTAIDGFGDVLAEIRLSDLAVYLSADSNEEIQASFEDPDGGTLLTVTAGGEGERVPVTSRT